METLINFVEPGGEPLELWHIPVRALALS